MVAEENQVDFFVTGLHCCYWASEKFIQSIAEGSHTCTLCIFIGQYSRVCECLRLTKNGNAFWYFGNSAYGSCKGAIELRIFMCRLLFNSTMLSTKKVIFQTLKLLFIFYFLICVVLYFFQEKLLFFPDKLDKNYKFSFSHPFDEVNTKTKDGNLLNGLLFKTDSAKGLVFYLHGNAGSLDNWGDMAKRYTELHYNVFILDYPGYGKSEGTIKSKTQLFDAIQSAYNNMKKQYHENSIIILGYSIGTGPAAYLASTNHPKLLVLQAPYYSLTDMMRHIYPIIPTLLLKYKFQTNEYLKDCTMPVVIFHGDKDEVIYYGSSLKLKAEMKTSDTLITLKGQRHNGMADNPEYITAIKALFK
jgi:alpha-beta hydrolase superfamily lysophospholipase